MIKVKSLGIAEEFSINNGQVLEYINALDFKTRLEFATSINIDTSNVSEQMQMLASYTNSLFEQELNPAQINVLKSFIKSKLNALP